MSATETNAEALLDCLDSCQVHNRRTAMNEEDFDALMHGRPFGTADAARWQAEQLAGAPAPDIAS
jgi:hypothetical protein